MGEVNRVGFTGTRRGMTSRQLADLEVCLSWAFAKGAEFHHGDCVGADAQAAAIAKRLGYRVIAHPGCNDWGKSPNRAFAPSDEVRPTRHYLLRNQDIVDSVDEMYATPDGPERMRNGTWAAVRAARRSGVKVVVLDP